jgi:uncharacterized protein YqgC (DUF456 family)
MDMFLVIASIVLGIVGIIGAIVPGIPGTPISFVGLLLLTFVSDFSYSTTFLVGMGVAALVITLLDYYIPIYGTKKLGGTKMGVRGSTIGLVFSIIILPLLGITIGPFGILGIVLCPFVGAYIGELMANNKANAFKSAIGSFIGFLAGTLIKVIYAIVVIIFVTKDGVKIIF